MKYAHLFNSSAQRGQIELYITNTPSLVGAVLHSTYSNKRTARAAVTALGAKPWNF